MIISTTGSIEGKNIKDYLGVVNTNFVLGTNIFSDMVAELSDVFGGTSGTYKNKLNLIYEKAMKELEEKATAMKADAIIGLAIDFDEVSGGGKSMFMVSATGTAVTFWNNHEERYSMYSALEKIYDYKAKGILTDDEYEYEKNHIKSMYTDSIKLELGYVDEQRKLEQIRMQEEEERRIQASKTAEQLFQEKFSELQGEDLDDIREDDILSASYDDIDYDSNDPIQNSVAHFIRLRKFAEACKFYMDETGLEDTHAAINFCIYIRKQIDNIDQDQLTTLINKMRVLKKRGFTDQAVSEYQKLTLEDRNSAMRFLATLEI